MASSVRIKYKKIEKNGENLSENIFVIVNTNTVDGDLQFNIQYLDIQLEEIAEKNKNISLVDLRGNKIDEVNGHPTVEKSLNMFKELQNSLKDLIYTTQIFVSQNSYTVVAAKPYHIH